MECAHIRRASCRTPREMAVPCTDCSGSPGMLSQRNTHQLCINPIVFSTKSSTFGTKIHPPVLGASVVHVLEKEQ